MAEIRADRSRTRVVWLVVTMCGFIVATLVAAVAALITAVLHGDAMMIFTVAGTTFGTCVTLEIALASLYLAGRRAT